MQEMLSKQKFEKEYSMWIRAAAKNIAFSLSHIKPDDVRKLLIRNEDYLNNPESVFGTDGLEVVHEFTPDNILFLSTDAVVFSQSIFAPLPDVFDYAVSMNRRYYIGSWYSIITLNRMYLKEASQSMLKYAIFHELLQKDVYEENMRKSLRKFTPEEKRKISKDTEILAIQKAGITTEELLQEKDLMLDISSRSPLIPKPFAETALYWYVEKNIESLQKYSESSRTEKEEAVGKKLNEDFKGWLDFSSNTYKNFLSELKKELNYMDYGYV